MKKTLKVLSILFVVISIITLSTSVFAAVKPDKYNGTVSEGKKVDTSSIDNLGNNIINIVSTVATIASVLVLIVLGIKYMMGSAEEKAEYKKTLLPYIIGAIMVFAAASLATVIFNFANTI